MSKSITKQVEVSLPPSLFVKWTRRYRQWCCIVICGNEECGTHGKYEDMHPFNPCFNCGNQVNARVGRWVTLYRPWWNFWIKKQEYWEIKT